MDSIEARLSRVGVTTCAELRFALRSKTLAEPWARSIHGGQSRWGGGPEGFGGRNQKKRWLWVCIEILEPGPSPCMSVPEPHPQDDMPI